MKVLIDFYLLFHLLVLIESYFLVLTKKGNKIRTYSQQTVKFPIGAKCYTYALHLDSFCTCLICCTCIIKFENKSIDKNSLWSDLFVANFLIKCLQYVSDIIVSEKVLRLLFFLWPGKGRRGSKVLKKWVF